MARSKRPIKPHKRQTGQFVGLQNDMLRSRQYRALSADARAILIDIHLGFHGHNNGAIAYSLRQAQECLKSGSERASKTSVRLAAIEQIHNLPPGIKLYFENQESSRVGDHLSAFAKWQASHAWKKQKTALE